MRWKMKAYNKSTVTISYSRSIKTLKHSLL